MLSLDLFKSNSKKGPLKSFNFKTLILIYNRFYYKNVKGILTRKNGRFTIFKSKSAFEKKVYTERFMLKNNQGTRFIIGYDTVPFFILIKMKSTIFIVKRKTDYAMIDFYS